MDLWEYNFTNKIGSILTPVVEDMSSVSWSNILWFQDFDTIFKLTYSLSRYIAELIRDILLDVGMIEMTVIDG